MNKLKKNFGQDDDTCTLLKNLHKKVYSICRLFTSNYAAHQSLFARIISAASQNLRADKTGEDKEKLFLRACINMAALQAITRNLAPHNDPTIQFKSPDYQKSMVSFRDAVGNAEEYEKIMLFLNFEKWPANRNEELSGISPADPDPVNPAFRKDRPYFTPIPKENSPARENGLTFQNIHTQKERLIWI
jgi:hypothetical protein